MFLATIQINYWVKVYLTVVTHGTGLGMEAEGVGGGVISLTKNA